MWTKIAFRVVTPFFLSFLFPVTQVRLRGGAGRRGRERPAGGEVLREDRPVSRRLVWKPALRQVRVRLRDARGGLLHPIRDLQDR